MSPIARSHPRPEAIAAAAQSEQERKERQEAFAAELRELETPAEVKARLGALSQDAVNDLWPAVQDALQRLEHWGEES